MSRPNLMEMHARERAGMGEDWTVFLYRWMPPGGPPIYLEMTGAVAPQYRTGPRKGRTNYRRRDRATERTVYIRVEEHDAWLARWEGETGQCRGCAGVGDKPWRSGPDGTETRPCHRCGGSGKALMTHHATEEVG